MTSDEMRRMLAGELYRPADPAIQAALQARADWLARYNAADARPAAAFHAYFSVASDWRTYDCLLSTRWGAGGQWERHMARTFGSYMLQPTKDELRHTIRALRDDRDREKSHRRNLEHQLGESERKLDEAARLLGRQVIEASLKGELASPEPPRLIRRI